MNYLQQERQYEKMEELIDLSLEETHILHPRTGKYVRMKKFNLN